MAKLTKQQKEETVEVYYGINPQTFEVESVYLKRGGKLSKYGRNGAVATHSILHGRSPHNEIVVVWGLTDIISFPPGMSDAEHVRKRLDELRQRAAEMKQLAEVRK